MGEDTAKQTGFRHCYQLTSHRVYAYVRRHAEAADCDDVIAEVYLAAWRRFADLPADPMPWLLAAARKALANHWRSRGRRQRLAAEIAGLAQLATPDSADLAIDRADLLAGLNRLLPDDREILLLTGWDGLDAAGLAAVLGCSVATARTRLSRARKRLAIQLNESPAVQPRRSDRLRLVERANEL